MMKRTLLLVTGSMTLALAQDYPPGIPEGQVTYDEVSYQSPGESELPAEFMMGDPVAARSTSSMPVTAPITPPPSSHYNTSIVLNAYTTNYNVRGMGVTNDMSKYGFSTLSASHTFANRNLFHRGIQHRVHGMAGAIWDASTPLGDIPLFGLGYAVGKEVLPNLLMEVGYNFRRGGLEGYMAKAHDRASHRSEQDIAFTITFDDHQKGFFGHAEVGMGFYGLTGTYMDAELGYRFTDVVRTARLGSDLEISAGVAPSFSYWGSGVEGVDACRIKAALSPYTHNGKLGRDAHVQLKPWVMCSWSCNNARKFSRHAGYNPVDHFLITVGVDVGFKF